MPNDTAEKIEYLLSLRFPDAEEALRLSGADDDDEAALEQLRREIEAYRGELELVPEGDLDSLIEVEEVRVQRQQQADREEIEEERRSFNRPEARADFAAWASFPSWTMEQAAALIHGRNPAAVNWEAVEKHLQESRFARRYAHTRERLKVGDIVFPASPLAVVNWTERSGLTIPAELAAQVRANSNPAPNEPEPQAQDGSYVKHPIVKAAGGSSVQAAKEAMEAIWGDKKPNGVKGHGYHQVNAWLKEHNRDTVSESTCKRAWNGLYGASRRGRPRPDPK